VTHVTCKLTAKNRDRLRNPTLGNRVWATLVQQLVVLLLQTTEMPFGAWTRVGSRNHVLGVCLDPPRGWDNFGRTHPLPPIRRNSLITCYVAAVDRGSRQLGELSVGQVVNAQVTSVTDDGVLCSLPHAVRGLVTTDHMPGMY